LCRLGFHRWLNYGNKVEVFWEEPPLGVGGSRYFKNRMEKHSKIVYEKCVCKRCGIKLKRKLATNPDGTVSSIGWEIDPE
jgi:hypothetical protein